MDLAHINADRQWNQRQALIELRTAATQNSFAESFRARRSHSLFGKNRQTELLPVKGVKGPGLEGVLYFNARSSFQRARADPMGVADGMLVIDADAPRRC